MADISEVASRLHAFVQAVQDKWNKRPQRTKYPSGISASESERDGTIEKIYEGCVANLKDEERDQLLRIVETMRESLSRPKA